jgi:hypothetical protein
MAKKITKLESGRRIIQISATNTGGGSSTVFGLDNMGKVWMLTSGGWKFIEAQKVFFTEEKGLDEDA